MVLVGNAKFFSNGLDLEWLGAHPSETPAFIASVHALLARLLGTVPPPLAEMDSMQE